MTAEAGGTAAVALGPLAGFNAKDSQATTLEVSAGDDVEVEAMESLEAHPGLSFTGKTAAREV